MPGSLNGSLGQDVVHIDNLQFRCKPRSAGLWPWHSPKRAVPMGWLQG